MPANDWARQKRQVERDLVQQASSVQCSNSRRRVPRQSVRSEDVSTSTEHKSLLPVFITKLFPSNKPERGGTLREHGVWEKPGYAEAAYCKPDEPSSTTSLQPERIDRVLTAPGGWPSATAEDTAPRATLGAGRLHPARKGQRLTESTLRAAALDKDLPKPDSLSRREKDLRRQRRGLKESGDYLGVQGVNPETGKLDVVTPTTATTASNSTIDSTPPKASEKRPTKHKMSECHAQRDQRLIQ